MPLLEDYQLIDLTEKYKDYILHWRNSDHVRAYMFTDRLITQEEHDLWFERAKNDNGLINGTIAKVLLYQSQPIGFVHFTHLDKEQRRCSWGFYIGEKSVPKGSGQIMAFLSLNTIFEEFHLRKLCSEVLACNDRSLRYHQRLGFVEEGRLKEHLFRKDHYEDVILMALFREQWIARQQELLQEWKNNGTWGDKIIEG
jgi:UDP-4-amino-4,6-dideoxy-N-acetyl-beta-L-altrosamine N-acetyltransferase